MTPVHGIGGKQDILAGPIWFQKMDVNGDGDLSPREFLGSREIFQKMDLNGDGLIDAAEAWKADAVDMRSLGLLQQVWFSTGADSTLPAKESTKESTTR